MRLITHAGLEAQVSMLTHKKQAHIFKALFGKTKEIKPKSPVQGWHIHNVYGRTSCCQGLQSMVQATH